MNNIIKNIGGNTLLSPCSLSMGSRGENALVRRSFPSLFRVSKVNKLGITRTDRFFPHSVNVITPELEELSKVASASLTEKDPTKFNEALSNYYKVPKQNKDIIGTEVLEEEHRTARATAYNIHDKVVRAVEITAAMPSPLSESEGGSLSSSVPAGVTEGLHESLRAVQDAGTEKIVEALEGKNNPRRNAYLWVSGVAVVAASATLIIWGLNRKAKKKNE